MIELTTTTIGILICTQLVITLFSIGFFIEDTAYGVPPIFLVVTTLLAILFLKDLTFQGVLTYTPYYGIGVLLWFFAKWFLTLWKTGNELKGRSLEDLKYLRDKVKQNRDGSFSMVQPEFAYLFSHAVAFPYSIIATFCDTILINLYNLFKAQMQKVADSFLPKDIK